MIIHREDRKLVEMLSGDEAKAMLLALMSDDGGIEALTPLATMAYTIIKDKSDRLSKRQSGNGSKGGRPKATETQTSHSNPPKAKKASVTVTDTDTVTVPKDTPPSPPRGRRAPIADFSIFWAAYPKKRAKGEAEKAWKAIYPDSELLTKMLSALGRATTCQDWTKAGGQYIPNPATWLRAKGWEDEYGDSPQAKYAPDSYAGLTMEE